MGMVVLGLIGWALGIDPWMLINGANVVMGGNQGGYQQPDREPQQQQTRRSGPPSDEAGKFVARVRGSTEVQWKDIFAKSGQTYTAPKLIMFSGTTRSACGTAQSAMGPFYCPNDREVYLDTSFFRDLEARFQGCSGKACDFSKRASGRASAIMCRTCSASSPRCSSNSRRPATRRYPTGCRSASNCRPIAWPASGPITPRRNTNSSIRATTTLRCRRPRRS